MNKKQIRSDALFIFLVALIIALMAALTADVETSRKSRTAPWSRPQMRKIDKALIEKKIKSKDLSDEEAKFYKKMDE